MIKSVLEKILKIILFLTLSGCSAVPLVISFSPEVEELRQGEQEFTHGNYQKADTIFSKVIKSHDNPQTRNTALYNLACTRIMTAKTNEDYLAAIALLNGWQQTSPGVMYVENPNLVISALKGHSSFMTRDHERILKQQKHFEELTRKTKKDRDTINNQIKTIADLKEALSTLQHQIAELEAIDQQLQEKKKPL